MGRKIDIRWPELDVTVVAELSDETNPELCEEFWQHLPFKVLQAHPVVSGESVYAWTPIVSTAKIRHREPIVDCPIGRLRYSQATGNKFSVQYGRGQEALAQPVLGMVLPEHHAVLPKVGKAIWENVFWRKDLYFVEVSPHDVNAKPAKPKPAAPLPAAAKSFIAEAQRIQTVEPEDLRKVRLGQLGDTGTYGQFFSAWDFVNGMLRDYIMYTIYPLLKLVDKLGPQGISQSLQEFDPNYSEYLGYSGLLTLERFAKELRGAVDQAKSNEEVKVLLTAFLLYGNRLCAWSYHYFPWYIGMFYGRQVNGQEFPGRWKPVLAGAAAD